jgi:hypothetical protein
LKTNDKRAETGEYSFLKHNSTTLYARLNDFYFHPDWERIMVELDKPPESGIAGEYRASGNALSGLESPSRRTSLQMVFGGFVSLLDATSPGYLLNQAGIASFLPPQDGSGGIAGVADDTDAERVLRDNFVTRRPSVIDGMQATSRNPTAGWVLSSGSATLAFDDDTARPNTGAAGCLELSGLGPLVAIRKDFGSDGIVPANGVLVMPVWLSEEPLTDAAALPVVARPYSIYVELCSDSAFAAGTSARLARSYIMTSAQFLRSGWNDVQVSASDDGRLNTTGSPGWTYSGTSPGNARSEYRYLRIIFYNLHATATQAPVVKLGGIYQGGTCSANVLMSCDDTHEDSIDIADAFNSFNIAVSLGVITGVVGLSPQMSAAQLTTSSAAGNDCTSHSVTHPPSAGLQAVTADQLDDETVTSRGWLMANGLARTANVFIYPQNSFGDREIAAVQAAGYVLARCSKPGWTPTVFGIDNPHALGSRDVGGLTLARVKLYLDSVQTYGCTLVLSSHRVASIPITSLSVAARVGTVVHPQQASRVPPGTTVTLRGFDNPACNASGTVESGSTTTGFRIRLSQAPSGFATSTDKQPRFFSPTFPAAGGPPPATTLHWYMSDYIALAREIRSRRSAGLLTPIGYATLLARCTLG